MKNIFGWIFAALLCAGLAVPAHAQTAAPDSAIAAPPDKNAVDALNPNKNQPIDITADQTLEWHRNDLQYIGHGNVIAKQGDATIKGDTLTADYRVTPTSKNDIYRMTAVGNVTVSSQDNNAVGDHAVYTTDDGIAVMTGKHLVLTSPDQVVTARDNFHYEVGSGRLTANGAARAIRTMDDGTKDVIDADQLSAWFVQPPEGGPRKLDHMTAVGHVVITTPTDVLHGDNGNYVAGSQIATVTGHVRIDRGPNVLVGDKADINLATNVSRMVNTPGHSARVHGIFYPNSDQPAGAKPGTPAKPPVSAKKDVPEKKEVKAPADEKPVVAAPQTPPPAQQDALTPPVAPETKQDEPAPTPVVETKTAPMPMPETPPVKDVTPEPPVSAPATPPDAAPKAPSDVGVVAPSDK